MSSWELTIKDLQGHTTCVTVPNPQQASVSDLKRLVTQQDNSVPVYEQRLVHERTELKDSCLLCSYPGIQSGSQIMLIRLIPFQVFVKGMDGSSYTLTIPSRTPETFSVAHFKKLLQERTHLRPEEQRLQYAGKELVDHMTLGDYNLVNNATLHLVSRLRGGVARLKGASWQRCVVSGVSSGTSSMSCGHAVSPAALYKHCMAAVRDGKDRVRCPICSAEWTTRELKRTSQLSVSQLGAIDEGLTRNFCLGMPGVITCEGCGTVWSGRSFGAEFCPSCATQRHDGKTATVNLLALCPTKKIESASLCPALRACPQCGNVIEHEMACRRVDCNRCMVQFCFVCLRVRTPTSSAYYPCVTDPCCTPAARQTTIA